MKEPLLERAAPWLAVLALLVLWEGLVRLLEVRSFILPAPTAVVASWWEFLGPIKMHAWQTFWTTMLGFGIAVAFGLVTGFVLGSSRVLYRRWRWCRSWWCGSASARCRPC